MYTKETFPEEWKVLQGNLASAAFRRAVENPSDAAEENLSRYELALNVIATTNGSREKVDLHVRVANLYIKRRIGDSGRNLETAIAHYEAALNTLETDGDDTPNIKGLRKYLADIYRARAADMYRARVAATCTDAESLLHDIKRAAELFPREESPETWARLHHNVGESYRTRAAGPLSDNIERAISDFEKALEVFTPDAFPVDCGLAENSLGAAYLMRVEGDQAENIERAIEHLTVALSLRPREKFETYWAKTKTNLGGAFMRRERGDSIENADLAIAHFEESLQVQAFAPEEQAISECNLAELWMERKSGDKFTNLTNSIRWGEAALHHLQPEDASPVHFRSRKLLGDAYRLRSEYEPNDSDPAIRHYEAAVELRFRDEHLLAWSLCQMQLGMLYDKLQNGIQIDNKRKALVHYEAALAGFESVPNPFAVATIHGWIAELLQELGSENRGRAITHLRLGIDGFPPDHPLEILADLHKMLGDAIYDHQTGDRNAALDEARKHYQRALQLRSGERTTDQVASLRSALGVVLLEQPGGSRSTSLEEAIGHQRAVMEIWTRDKHPHGWALAHHNLGNVYAERIEGDRAENLEEAINCFNTALEIFTKEKYPEDWAMTHNSLGGVYAKRIRGERAENIEKSIVHYYTALQVYTRDKLPYDWGMTMYNLGAAYKSRLREGEDRNLEAAIRCFEQALEVRTKEHLPFFWAMTKVTLGIAYSDRHHGERVDNIALAITHLREAAEIYTREEFPDQWAGIENALAGVYLDDERGDTVRNLEKAIVSYKAALEVNTRAANPDLWAVGQNNLAVAYSKLTAKGDLAKRSMAIDHFLQALQVFTPEVDPKRCARSLEGLAKQYALSSEWQVAHETFERAIEVGDALLVGAVTPAGRQEEAAETSELYACSAYCLLKLGKREASLARLEAGKARLLFESLSRNDLDLADLSPELAEQIREARMRVRVLEAELRASESEIRHTGRNAVPRDRVMPSAPKTGELGFSVKTVTFRQANEMLLSQGFRLDFATMLRKARQELQRLTGIALSDTRYHIPPGLDSDAIRAEVPVNGALVTLMITPLGSAVWVLPHGIMKLQEKHAVPLPDQTYFQVRKLTFDWLNAYLDWQFGGPLDAWQRFMEGISGRLWDVLAGPIHARLSEFGLQEGAPVVLIPHAGAGLMPLHAARRDTREGPRAFLDDYTLTTAPSVYAVHVSRRRLEDAARQGESFLAVVNPTGDLPFAEVESTELEALFGNGTSSKLVGPDATEEHVVNAIPGRAYLHFACHGRYDWRNVLRSELILADESQLTLARIVSPEVDLSALRLVVLSACETGLIEFEQAPDESLGLPAGFLEAGAPGVVSTLWAVNDFSMALLIEDFYRRHRKQKQAIAPALRGAQRWLRDATARELCLAERWERLYRASTPPDPNAFKLMRYFQANPKTKPFASPYYWAAPIFTGA
ncbi:MAG: CHAT domain-containing protein [Verrucomicrobia bacterium]|nr:CHAT domain-containing protein [Verrucomicrobiota bacterium]